MQTKYIHRTGKKSNEEDKISHFDENFFFNFLFSSDIICLIWENQLTPCLVSIWPLLGHLVLSGGKTGLPQCTEPHRNLVKANLVSHFLQKTLV